MPEFRVSVRIDLDAGEAGKGRSDAPMAAAMEMATPATPIAAETPGAARFERRERNENGKRRMGSESPVAPSDWMSRMERTLRQQGQELTQLRETVGHLANLVEARAAREEAQWLAMMMWMQEREQKWEARYEDDKVWGAGITNIIAKTMKGVAEGQEEREREREVTARTDGGGLEASQHADTTREDRLKERQQPQQQQQPKPRPKLRLKPQQKPRPVPKPKSAATPTPARWWETVPPRAKSQRAPVGPSPGPGPGPALTAGSSMAQRRLILTRDESVPLSNPMEQEMASAITRALLHPKAPAHIRFMNAKRNAKGAIAAITHPNATAEMALQYCDIIITAARTVDNGVVDVEENESWERLKIHPVPLIRYMGKGTEGLQKMREAFAAENDGIVIPTQVRRLGNPRTIRERRQKGEIAVTSVVFVVKGSKMAQSIVKRGNKAAGVWYRVEK